MAMVSEFDMAAATYDADFTASSIGMAQRGRVYHYLDIWLKGLEPQNVLEVNCGTGADAIYLAQKGHKITATDGSEAMLDRAKEKAAGLDVRFFEMDLRDMENPLLEPPYDLIFSNFGGLNCLHPASLAQFLEEAAKLLGPNGQMLLVLMSRNCLLESWYYKLKGNKQQAKRRENGGPLNVEVNGVDVPTWYYNPDDLKAMLPESLRLKAAHPIGICIPPSYLQTAMDRNPWMLKLGKMLEPLFSGSRFAKYGDHYILKIGKQ